MLEMSFLLAVRLLLLAVFFCKYCKTSKFIFSLQTHDVPFVNSQYINSQHIISQHSHSTVPPRLQPLSV
jgi:hypothetical protein